MADTLPPRNVIYYSSSASPITLLEIASLPCTDVILGFLIPDPTVTKLIADGGVFTDKPSYTTSTLIPFDFSQSRACVGIASSVMT